MTVPTLHNNSSGSLTKAGCDPTRSVGLYLHIPYCRQKCPYCSFASSETAVIPERDYLECLKAEFKKIRHIKGEEAFSAKIEYRGPSNQRGILPRIQVDLTYYADFGQAYQRLGGKPIMCSVKTITIGA